MFACGDWQVAVLMAVMSGGLVLATPLYPPAKGPFVTLVQDGKPLGVIVRPADAPLEVERAAAELVKYIEKMSGAKLPIAESAPADEPALVLRVDPTVNPAADPPAKDWPGSRGYYLHTAGRHVEIIGAHPISVLHGAYALLERHLGCRWCMPGDIGEVVPEAKTVRVGRLEEHSVPAFKVRWVGTGDWALKHGANAMVKIGDKTVGVNWKWHFHTFCTLIPAEKYYDRHPEWWPLIGGKRQRPTRPHSHSTQLCTTNPEMVAEMTKNLIAVLDEDPSIDIIALSPNDGGGFCECANCTALDEPDRGWFARYSKRLAVLNNQVAAEVAKRHPKVLIKVGAYAMYLRRPLGDEFKPTPNQLVQICHIYCCHNHPIKGNHCREGKTHRPSSNFMENREFLEQLKDWRSVSDHVFIYEYYTLGGPSRAKLFWPMVHTMREDMPLYHELGAEGFYTQLSNGLFGRQGLNYYVCAKLAWDTSLDVDALVEDYCEKFYGPAKEPMLKFWLRLEKAFVDSDLCLSYGLDQPKVWGPKVLTDEVMAECGDLLKQAAALGGDGVYKHRINLAQKAYDDCAASLAGMKK